MPTTPKTTRKTQTENELRTTEIFELLSNERRYRALEYLMQAVGAVPISDLADHIALSEGEHTHERYERVCTSLVHVHLPKLVDAEVVEYDHDREAVDLLGAADDLRPYLEPAESAEGQ